MSISRCSFMTARRSRISSSRRNSKSSAARPSRWRVWCSVSRTRRTSTAGGQCAGAQRPVRQGRGRRGLRSHRPGAGHVQLCWLALLLIRVIENGTGDTWRNVRHELDRMHLVTMETADGRVAQRTTTTTRQAEIFAALEIAEPGRFLDFELPTPSA